MKKRIYWIDILKGVGMLLIMLGHAPIPKFLVPYIYSFHVPLFFCISGFLFSIKKYTSFGYFLKSKLKGLLIPYLIFSLFNYIAYLIYSFLEKKVVSIKPLLGILLGIRDSQWSIGNGPLWFVLALFVSEIMFYFIIVLTKENIKKIGIILFLFSIIGYFYNEFIGIKLVWSIDAALIAVTFVGLGYIIKRLDIINKVDNYTTFIILVVINIIFATLNIPYLDMFYDIYGNYIYFYLAAISGIISMFVICKKVRHSKLLEFIGQNSFVYLGIHQYIIYSILRKMLNKIIYTSNNNTLICIGVLYVLFTLIVLYLPIKFINKYCPFILGKTKEQV